MRKPADAVAPPGRGDAERGDPLRSLAFTMVGLMPAERRAVFALAVGQSLSYREIAERLGLAEDAINLHIREGLAIMYREVQAQVVEPAASGT